MKPESFKDPELSRDLQGWAEDRRGEATALSSQDVRQRISRHHRERARNQSISIAILLVLMMLGLHFRRPLFGTLESRIGWKSRTTQGFSDLQLTETAFRKECERLRLRIQLEQLEQQIALADLQIERFDSDAKHLQAKFGIAIQRIDE